MRISFLNVTFLNVIVFVSAALVFTSVAPGQQGQRAKAGKAAEPPKSNLPFDPHDLSGIWEKSRGTLLTMSNEVPAFTPAGKAKFDATKPGYGPRMVPPALGNDPMGTCDPLGMPRSLLMEVSINKMEIAQLPNRMFQFFEWQHSYRDIWTDGRELPKDPDPHWMGYSVGKWDGDTFVVNSLGFDSRTWLDHFGNPVSEAMKMEERYHRADHDTLELTITLTDPTMYTKPWVSQKRILRLANQKGFDEIFCVPSEEQAFNARVRDPAGKGK